MKLVIFDCDGTLVDSQHAIHAAMEFAFQGLDLPVPPRDAVLRVVGLSLPEAFLVLAPKVGDPLRRELMHRFKTTFPLMRQETVKDAPLFPGAKETVAALAARDDIVLGVATGKSRRGVDRLFEQEGWRELFRTIQTADDHPSKPHPSMIEAAMAEVGIGPGTTVMIGDTTYDIEMGHNAGVATIAVGWGYHGRDELTAAGAHRLIDRFDDLEGSIETVIQAGEIQR